MFQDVFAKAYTELQQLRDPSALRPWLAQLTRRACIDRLRRDRSSADELPDVEDPSETLAELERALDVHEAMRTLGDACNEILDRFFARDESYRTIAEELDLAPGTIASRISRCLGKLRAAMEDSPAPARQVDR